MSLCIRISPAIKDRLWPAPVVYSNVQLDRNHDIIIIFALFHKLLYADAGLDSDQKIGIKQTIR
jgi:hypothetical protein